MDNLSPQKAGRNIHVVEFNEAKPRYVFQVNQSLPLTMPFGSTAALEYFHYFIPNILIGRTGKETATYLKEIAVNTKKGLDHKHMVAKILDILSRHNPWSKPENCEFRVPWICNTSQPGVGWPSQGEGSVLLASTTKI